MIYAQVTLVFVQFLAIVACAFLALRLLTQSDALKHAQASFDNKLQAVTTIADLAKREVEALTVEHYKALQAEFLALETKMNSTKALQLSMEESIASVNNKLASRDRQDKYRAKREEKEDAQELPVTSGLPPEIQAMLANGEAYLPPSQPQAPAPVRRGLPENFGRNPS